MTVSLTRDGDRVREALEFRATVVEASANRAVLETCPTGSGAGGEGGDASAGAGGANDCGEDDLRLELEAPGLAPTVDVGVELDVSWETLGGLGPDTMAVLREPGDTSTTGIVLAATTGVELAGVPVRVTPEDLRCVLGEPIACGSPTAYALDFEATENPPASLRLTMGETGTLPLAADSDTVWRFHDIRSYTSGACDETGSLRYYVVRED